MRKRRFFSPTAAIHRLCAHARYPLTSLSFSLSRTSRFSHCHTRAQPSEIRGVKAALLSQSFSVCVPITPALIFQSRPLMYVFFKAALNKDECQLTFSKVAAARKREREIQGTSNTPFVETLRLICKEGVEARG